MKTYITGYKGYVGKELLKRGFLPLDCNVANADQVERVIRKVKPDLLIHLAGKSDVDFCQKLSHQKEVTRANVIGVSNIFRSLHSLRLPGVLLSTDQIWHGRLFERHKEDSPLTPTVNFYGMTKVVAEQRVKSLNMNIIRTSYLFDSQRLSAIATDQPVFIQRSFLHLYDFCDMLEKYCEDFYKMPKLLHLAGGKRVSWYSFARSFSPNIKPRFFEKKGFAPRPWFGGLNVNLSLQLGFPKINYLDGLERIHHES